MELRGGEVRWFAVGCDGLRIAGTSKNHWFLYGFCTWTRPKSDSTRIRPEPVGIRPDTVRSKPFETNVKQILLVFGSVFGLFFDRFTCKIIVFTLVFSLLLKCRLSCNLRLHLEELAVIFVRTWSQLKPKLDELGANFVQLTSNLGEPGSNLGPRWANLGPIYINLGPGWANWGPTSASLGPIWPDSVRSKAIQAVRSQCEADFAPVWVRFRFVFPTASPAKPLFLHWFSHYF